jgi:hypothetical protein
MWEESAYEVYAGKPKGRRPLGRPIRRREGNINIYLKEIVSDAVDWIHLSQGRDQWRELVNTVMNVRIL